MKTEEQKRSDTKSDIVTRSTLSEIIDEAIKAARQELSDAEISVNSESSPPKREPAKAAAYSE